MAYGSPANVRSHRRGGRRPRRRRFAPWLSGTLVTVLLAAGLVFAYTQLLAHTCSGEQSIRIAASPSTAPLLTSIARGWHASEPATQEGICARVQIESMHSHEAADRLAGGWDAAANPPHVWVPTSTAWAQKAAASDLAEPLIPDLRPSIARTPTVIAMPQPMAEALNWPDTQLDPDADVRWESLVEEFGDTGDPGWARFGHEEWGSFRFGMSNPARDTAGLLALTAILDADDSGDTSPEELESAFRLQQLLDADRYFDTSEQLFSQLRDADREGAEEALTYVSAFPALEQEVFAYNRDNPRVPLAAVYPVNGNIEADHPYLVLNADWVTPAEQEVAELFLAEVRSDHAQALLREEGFRGTNREPGEDFRHEYGLVPELVALPRAVLVPDAVTLTIDRWTALTRSMNVLIVFDVSGSMLWEIPGTGIARMDQAIEAATATVELFDDTDQVGFWEFATALDGDLDYRQLVPIGPLDDVMGDSRTRREHMLDAIAGLVPLTDTGLYNTIQAAYDTVLDNYHADATNMVVVLTDGEDDTAGRPGISLEELLAHFDEAPDDRPVHVVPVAFGEEPDFEIMHQIADATGGAAYYSVDGFDLVDLFRTAVFSTVS
jgi:Ca-activated chloride channel homolog